tara:strand:+ start:195 stop:995 length:801 start_codon:yes stop_codon:yes gene_type:complete
MNIKKNITNFLRYPFLSSKLLVKIFKDIFFKKIIKNNSKKFFDKKDLLQYFISGEEKEIHPDYTDLKNIYELIIKRKPKCIVEFGSGFSTIAICLALKENELKNKISGRLFSVDGNEDWIKNTENKIANDLKKYVQFHYSKASISSHNGQIVSYHNNLPNVSPNFIYLDGPSPLDVGGNINGISFQSKNINNNDSSVFYKNNSRRIVSADPLLYESTAPSDFFILVDRRYTNTNFLEKNLVFDYTVKKDISLGGVVSFEKKYQPYP